MERPCTDRPSSSVCTGAAGRPAGTAWLAVGDGDGDGGGAGEGAGREVTGDGVPAAGGAAPVVAVAAGEAVEARVAGAAARRGCLPWQAEATSTHAANPRQIGRRTNIVVAPSSRPYPLPKPSCYSGCVCGGDVPRASCGTGAAHARACCGGLFRGLPAPCGFPP